MSARVRVCGCVRVRARVYVRLHASMCTHMLLYFGVFELVLGRLYVPRKCLPLDQQLDVVLQQSRGSVTVKASHHLGDMTKERQCACELLLGT